MNWGTRHSNCQNSAGHNRSTINIKKLRQREEQRTEISDGLVVHGIGGDGYRGGSSNCATKVPDQGFGGMRIEECGGG